MIAFTQERARAIFVLAGLQVLDIKPLIDGYSYSPDDDRFYKTPPRTVWWFVKTPFGWIEIGYRKSVISIDWSDTGIKFIVTDDSVTKGYNFVHAHSEIKAVEYLQKLTLNASKYGPEVGCPIGYNVIMDNIR